MIVSVFFEHVETAAHFDGTAETEHARQLGYLLWQVLLIAPSIDQVLVARIAHLVVVDCLLRRILLLLALRLWVNISAAELLLLGAASIVAVDILGAVVRRRQPRVLTVPQVVGSPRRQGAVSTVLRAGRLALFASGRLRAEQRLV